MNITKEEYIAYVNRSMDKDKRKVIDAYLETHPIERMALEGALAFQEEASFEDLINDLNYAIANRVTSDSNSISLDVAMAPQEAKSDIEEVRQPSVVEGKGSNVRKLYTRWAMIAAAAVIALFFMVRTQTGSQEIVMADYLDAYPDVISNIVRGEKIEASNESLMSAMRFYNDGDMASAEPILQKLSDESPKDQNITFYLAIAELFSGDYRSSLSRLESLTSEDAYFPYDDGARWYQAICLLQLERVKEAKEILTKISTERHYKKDEAIELLTTL